MSKGKDNTSGQTYTGHSADLDMISTCLFVCLFDPVSTFNTLALIIGVSDFAAEEHGCRTST